MKLLYQSTTNIEEFDQDEDGETCVVDPLEEFEVDEEDFKKSRNDCYKTVAKTHGSCLWVQSGSLCHKHTNISKFGRKEVKKHD